MRLLLGLGIVPPSTKKAFVNNLHGLILICVRPPPPPFFSWAILITVMSLGVAVEARWLRCSAADTSILLYSIKPDYILFRYS